MKKWYAKHSFQPPKTGREYRPLTYADQVKRIYPSAMAFETPDARYVIMPRNGTGNILAEGDTAIEAWKAAAIAVKPPRKATV